MADATGLPAGLKVTSIIFKDYFHEGLPSLDNFVSTSSTLDPASLTDGSILVELLYLSVDPYMRTRMSSGKNYRAAFTPGHPYEGYCLGRVRASKGQRFKAGDVVRGMLPWSTYSFIDEAGQAQLQQVEPALLGQLPLSYFLGTLGMPGLTAYASLRAIAEPKVGETAFISAAAGAVGQVVGQLLKNVYGCRVIGSVGAGDKVSLLQRLGFDAAFNYKEVDTRAALQEHAPGGIDIYFENVGGETLDIVLDLANKGARIVACGMISQYNLPPEQRYGVKNLFQIVGKEIKMQGFIVGSLAKAHGASFAQDMAGYIKEGKVQVQEHLVKGGIQVAGEAFLEMMQGGNVGKAVVQVVEQDPHSVGK